MEAKEDLLQVTKFPLETHEEVNTLKNKIRKIPGFRSQLVNESFICRLLCSHI